MSETPHAGGSRTVHIVLVPGFFGFDALGQIEYYAGTTPIFNDWRRNRSENVTLHYFDNYPTASVSVRAQRLHNYLATRIDRGEIGPNDRVALVGHSTGGLDIRRMLYLLALEVDSGSTGSIKTSGTKHGEGQSMPYNEAQQTAQVKTAQVKSAQVIPLSQAAKGDSDPPTSSRAILDHVERIVFLSVPHYGTSLADFATTIRDTFRTACALFRIVVESNDGVSLDGLKTYLELHNPLESQSLLASLDALSESDERPSKRDEKTPDPMRDDEERAIERENRSDLCLWLEHMSKDLGIIADLRGQAPAPNGAPIPSSPAHFDETLREREIGYFAKYGIETLSYVTRAPKPVGHERRIHTQILGALAPSLRKLPQFASWSAEFAVPVARSLAKGIGSTVACCGLLAQCAVKAAAEQKSIRKTLSLFKEGARAGGDVLFRTLHTICATTDLASKQGIATSSFIHPDRKPLVDAGCNDGIVNTISMAYPFDRNHPSAHASVFVDDCDHADIIGHYQLTKRDRPGKPKSSEGRRFESYDIFRSGSKFDKARFETIWRELFDFCVEQQALTAVAGAEA